MRSVGSVMLLPILMSIDLIGVSGVSRWGIVRHRQRRRERVGDRKNRVMSAQRYLPRGLL